MVIAGNEPDLILIEILPKTYCNSLSAPRLSLLSYQSFFNFDPDSPQPTHHLCCVGIYVSDKFSVSEVLFSVKVYFTSISGLKLNSEIMTPSWPIGWLYLSQPNIKLSTSTAALCDLFRSVTGYTHLLITGDFNYQYISLLLYQS